MKLHILVTILCLMCASEFVTAMDYEHAYLKFKLDNDLHVVASKANHMEFLVPPSEFTGKIITEVVPLDPADKKALQDGFESARTNGDVVKVPYELKGKYFIATIRHKEDGFSVMVKYLILNVCS